MNARGTARRGPSAAAVAQAAQSRERLGGELAAVAARLAGKTQATLLKLFDPALLNLLHSGTEFLLANCQPGTVAGRMQGMETLVADDAQRADSPRENPAQQKLPEAEPSELQFKTLRSMVFLAPSFLADERWSGWRAGLRLPHGKSELMKGFEDLASLALKRKLLACMHPFDSEALQAATRERLRASEAAGDPIIKLLMKQSDLMRETVRDDGSFDFDAAANVLETTLLSTGIINVMAEDDLLTDPVVDLRQQSGADATTMPLRIRHVLGSLQLTAMLQPWDPATAMPVVGSLLAHSFMAGKGYAAPLQAVAVSGRASAVVVSTMAMGPDLETFLSDLSARVELPRARDMLGATLAFTLGSSLLKALQELHGHEIAHRALHLSDIIYKGVDAAAIAEAANSGAGLSALAEKLAGSRLLIDGFSCAAPTVLCDLVDEGTPARQLLPSAAYRRAAPELWRQSVEAVPAGDIAACPADIWSAGTIIYTIARLGGVYIGAGGADDAAADAFRFQAVEGGESCEAALLAQANAMRAHVFQGLDHNDELRVPVLWMLSASPGDRPTAAAALNSLALTKPALEAQFAQLEADAQPAAAELAADELAATTLLGQLAAEKRLAEEGEAGATPPGLSGGEEGEAAGVASAAGPRSAAASGAGAGPSNCAAAAAGDARARAAPVGSAAAAEVAPEPPVPIARSRAHRQLPAWMPASMQGSGGGVGLHNDSGQASCADGAGKEQEQMQQQAQAQVPEQAQQQKQQQEQQQEKQHKQQQDQQQDQQQEQQQEQQQQQEQVHEEDERDVAARSRGRGGREAGGVAARRGGRTGGPSSAPVAAACGDQGPPRRETRSTAAARKAQAQR
ncbi:hypothetical protein MNEG_1570 [Monoraphidium neglectum]|uniref:Protein kinase domain-containing protein n=1 Tax=Monoraphidium neglectum TaxID=145388 RepID=A0A0D2K827_9CHLO|nr:hypothetical protein MNEG_1570 [Monoraphidium neglectum]KIZ06383.1 hypothetical protein MNEG_1570 [Monoraphidium neglectum]|eukprot:XP_013905402.1 hypothetical protein MNEG_1570 [Monoraphidium neglectum]